MREQTRVAPPVGSGDTPEFTRLGERKFEDLCLALLDVHDSVVGCDRFGVRGQKQLGVDLTGALRAGGKLVAQCKSHRQVTAQLVDTASQDFLAHWDDYWSERDVRRFVLLLASHASRREVQEAIDAQRRRFAELGVDFEVWDSNRLANRLGPHRTIVARFMPAWADDLCGGSPPPSLRSASIRSEAALDVTSASAGQTAIQLDAIQDQANEGCHGAALEALQEIQADAMRWSALSPRDQARTLRLQAVILHVRGTALSEVVPILDRADALFPPQSRAARARIVESEQGPGAALRYLDNPSGADECTAAARLHLLLDQPQAALEVLATLDATCGEDAEVNRWSALAYLVSRDLGASRLAVGRALQVKPRHISVRMAAGMVEYFSALSPAAQPNRIMHWPQPVSWELVRRDNDSLAHLNAATAHFSAILELLVLASATDDDVAPFKVWRLACLANLAAKTEEAEDYCREILKANPRNHMAIAWALARNWRIPYGVSAKALARALEAGERDGEAMLALVGLRLRAKRYDDALDLLHRHSGLLEGERGAELSRLWRSQILTHAGRLEEANVVADTASDKRSDAAFWIARWATAEKARDFESYLRDASAAWQAHGDADPLVRGCFLLASRRRVKGEHWVLLGPHREFLESAIGTAASVHLSSRISCELHEYAACLRTLDERRGAFADGRLPADLRQARLVCCQRLGLVQEALAEAEALAREEPTHANLFNVVQMHVSMGDTQAAALAARRLLDSPALSSQEALYLARTVSVDSVLARAFLRQGHVKGFSDEQAPAAWMVGSALGVDEAELRPLLAQMAALAVSGRSKLVQSATLDDLVAHVARARERGEALERQYREAAVPMHFIAEAQGFQLAWPYRAWPRERESSASPQGVLLTRWGGYPAMDAFTDDPRAWPLLADASSLLLGEHFAILDAVERTFGPIHVPHSLIQALDQMVAEIRPAQPKRIEDLEAIERLIACGKLRVRDDVGAERWPAISDALAEDMGQRWAEIVSAAHVAGGVVVAFMPTRRLDRKEPPRELSLEVEACLVSGGDVARALRDLSVISEAGYTAALPFLEQPAVAAVANALPRGAHLFLDLGLGSSLACAGILEAVCREFVVALDAAERRRVAEEIAAARSSAELAEWVSGVKRRVSEGLRGKRYKLRAAVPDERLPSLSHPGAASRTLLEALVPSDEPASLLWVEDRCISARVPRWGIYEILRALRHYKAVDDKTYFDRVLRLRRARVYFVPADADELVYWLQQAAARDRFSETEELAVIRRYFASAFEAEIFIVPDGDGGSAGEAPFVANVLHAVRAALRAVWAGPESDDVKASMSEWLWESLSIHEVGRLPFGSRDPRHEQLALSLASLAMLDPVPDAAEPWQGARACADWIEQRLLVDRFDADPGLRPAVARHVSRYLHRPPPKGDEDESDEASWRHIMGGYADNLPTSLREEIQSDAQLMTTLGRQLRAIVVIGPLSFPRATVWDDLARAVDEGHAQSTTTGGDVVDVAAVRKGAGVGLLTFSGADREPWHWPSPLHGLLSRDVRDREAALRRHRRAFDCSNARFETVLAEIATLPKPGDRIDAAATWINSSAAARYDALTSKVQTGTSFQREDLAPPPIERLLGCWRLSPTAGAYSATHFDDAARTLITDLGLHAALVGLAALPVPLPAAIVDAVAALSGDERQALLHDYDARSYSVVARFHGLWLRLRFSDGDDALTAARQRLAGLVREGLRGCRTVLSLAQLAAEQVQGQARCSEVGLAGRLAAAWLHAHEVDARLRAVNAPDDWIQGLRAWAARGAPVEWLRPVAALLQDAAWPQHLTPEALLLFGLAYAASADPPRAAALFAEQREALFECLTWAADADTRLPVAGLLRGSRTQPDALGSFLSRRPEEATVLGAEIDQLLTPEFLDLALHWIAQQLEERPSDLQLWMQVVARLAIHSPTEALAARLEALLPRVQVRSLMATREDAPGALDVLLFACAQRGLGQLRLHEDLVRTLLVDGARRLSELGLVTEPGDRVQAALWEACRRGAIVSGDAEASARALALSLRAVVDAWPALGAGCRVHVQWLCDRLPVAQAKWLWRLLTHLRALP